MAILDISDLRKGKHKPGLVT